MRVLFTIAGLAFFSAVLGAEPIHAPAFGDFATHEELSAHRANVALASHPLARNYRTVLREAAGAKANFAGHYVIASWGCGNECVQSLLVDLNSGTVYGVVGSNEGLQSSRGIDIRLDSRLLIADPPCDDNQSCLSEALSNIPVRYYVLEERGLRLIKEMPCHVVKGKECL